VYDGQGSVRVPTDTINGIQFPGHVSVQAAGESAFGSCWELAAYLAKRKKGKPVTSGFPSEYEPGVAGMRRSQGYASWLRSLRRRVTPKDNKPIPKSRTVEGSGTGVTVMYSCEAFKGFGVQKVTFEN
jgi:hypothetical protein